MGSEADVHKWGPIKQHAAGPTAVLFSVEK